MTDNEWVLKHKEEIKEVENLIISVKNDKKASKIYNKFLKKKNNENMRINYNTVNIGNDNNYKVIGVSKTLNTSIKSNYFIYDKSFNIDKRFS